RHKAERPRHWQTIEEGRDLSGAIKMAISSSPQAIIVDCLTLWVSNLLLSQTAEEGILDVAKGVASLAAGIKPQIVFVTNEVGAGIVPENGLARRFRDLAGMVNRIFAAQSQSVYMLVCGAPLKLSL
ncbi:MAG: bifunctional adenosylcobinamide kinase/adenosylcobinamide-phosphate guanylyltransferase, partial [Candidatus Omnitrophota bacterium]